MQKFATASALALAASGEEVQGGTVAITFSDCGTASTHGKISDVQPREIQLGSEVTLVGKGTVDEDVTGGAFKIEAKAGGGLIDKTWNGDVCKPLTIDIPLGLGTVTWKGMNCPVKAGDVSVELSAKISGAVPASLATADIALSGTGTAGEDLLCVNFHLKQKKTTASAAIPTVSLGLDVHGKEVLKPVVGAGTWQYNDDVAYSSVCQAFAAGYTFVDTANGYHNQKGVGKAIKDCWKGKREELFVMTKVPGGLSREETLAAHKENMEQLGLDYVDHLMTHYPADWDASPGRATPERRQEEWKALEEVYKSGAARSIGISHYCSKHIDDVLAVATVKPSVNQVEYHVGSQDVDEVIQKCKDEGIHFMSFSPLCGPCDISDPKDSLITGDLVSGIGAKHGKSGAQVALRWIVQQALSTKHIAGVIPKSNNAKHLASNIDLFDFELSEDDMNALGAATQPEASGGDCDVTAVV